MQQPHPSATPLSQWGRRRIRGSAPTTSAPPSAATAPPQKLCDQYATCDQASGRPPSTIVAAPSTVPTNAQCGGRYPWSIQQRAPTNKAALIQTPTSGRPVSTCPSARNSPCPGGNLD